ncbi:UNKNOWN [Stylonychia lemnae]|uniref:Uncharacterized protein n=1 Tax=Stylonychia lemnae TaxID=5949 RepID=A0A078BEA0_STYLE|nr:UNKNOWN [Stylonychia lemnae]|eukprot:CDW91457.1 UNKNOWN [Stylonychia lemnae]
MATEVLQELDGIQDMDRFRNIYIKLNQQFQASYESEKQLVTKCNELNETIYTNETRVKAAIFLAKEDERTINILKKEVDKAWILVDKVKERELDHKKIIEDLKNQLDTQNKNQEGASCVDQVANNSDVERLNEELKKECEEKTQIIKELETQNISEVEQIQMLQSDINKLELEVQEGINENQQLQEIKEEN